MSSIMSLLDMSTSKMTRLTYVGAAKLKEEMSRPGGQPEKLDYSILACCFHCSVLISEFLGNKVLDLLNGVYSSFIHENSL